MQVMHGMSNLVECLIFRHHQVALIILGALFKKGLHLPRRVQKVRGSVVLFGLKVFYFVVLNIEFVDNFCHLVLQHLKSLCIVDLVEDSVPIYPEVLKSLVVYLLFQLWERSGVND